MNNTNFAIDIITITCVATMVVYCILTYVFA